jgi:hypothetical protein
MLMKAQSKEFHKRPKVVDYDDFVSLVAERPWCGPGRPRSSHPADAADSRYR